MTAGFAPAAAEQNKQTPAAPSAEARRASNVSARMSHQESETGGRALDLLIVATPTVAPNSTPRRQHVEPQLKPIAGSKQDIERGVAYDAAPEAAVTPEARSVLRNTYLLLALTMVPTLIGAFIGMATSGFVLQYPLASTLVMLAGVIGLQYGIAANRNNGLGMVLLLLMTGILGWWLGPILNVALELANGMQLVGYAAVGTGVIFFAMGAVATTTKRDFSFMGKFLFVGMIALLVAMIANIFLQIPALALTISTLVIVVFSLFLLYDLNRIVRGGETNYMMATIGVYLSLYNIFANLLMLLMALAGDRR
jgi:modulator of FtsH protease